MNATNEQSKEKLLFDRIFTVWRNSYAYLSYNYRGNKRGGFVTKGLANIFMKLKAVLLKNQKYLLVFALVLSSIAISIRSNDGEIDLVLHKYPALIFLLVVISSFLVAIYFQINRKKISSLLNQIKVQSEISSEGFDALLNGLTERQREVYDLIISGKSNKEIMAELFIEQSTLKSHVNQIYKKLNIKSRSELKLRH